MKWIKCSEQMPALNALVLIYNICDHSGKCRYLDCDINIATYSDESRGAFILKGQTNEDALDAQYWMTLPTKPKE